MEYKELAPGFSISRILTGLWQIADMERDGRAVDAGAAAKAMGAYVEAGFTTFDMADHTGDERSLRGSAVQAIGITFNAAPAPFPF